MSTVWRSPSRIPGNWESKTRYLEALYGAAVRHYGDGTAPRSKPKAIGEWVGIQLRTVKKGYGKRSRGGLPLRLKI